MSEPKKSLKQNPPIILSGLRSPTYLDLHGLNFERRGSVVVADPQNGSALNNDVSKERLVKNR